MTDALWKLLFSVFLGVLQVADTSLLIRKCCQEGVRLKINNYGAFGCSESHEIEYSSPRTFTGTKRVSEVQTPSHPELPSWMDPKLTVLSATTLAPVSRFLSDQGNESYIEYGDGRSPVYSLTEAVVRSTYGGCSLLHNGSLMFQTHDGNNFSFPPRSYCADSASFQSGETSFVYLVEPCVYMECMTTCCPPDDVLNVWWGIARCIEESTGASRFHGHFSPANSHDYMRRVCSYVEQDHAWYQLDNILWNTTTYFGNILSLHYFVPEIHSKPLLNVDACVDIRSRKYEYQFLQFKTEDRVQEPFYFVVKYCSTGVLVLTLLVFVLTGEASRSKSKLIVSHISSALIAEVCSAILRPGGPNHEFVRLVRVLYVPYFSMAGPLWINVLCFDLAASFRSFWVSNPGRRSKETRWFLYYNIYVWGVAAVTRMLINIFARDELDDEYISHFHIPFMCGMVNFVLLSYTVIQLVRRQRQGRVLDVRSSAASCFSKHRRLLVHINLLLLMGPPSACAALVFHKIGPYHSVYSFQDWMKLLRAISILLFVLLKPRIWILLSNKMKTFVNLFARKEAPIPSGPRTATTVF